MDREAMTIRLPADLARRLRLRAAEKKESMNAIIERAVRKELGEMASRDEFARALGYADWETLTTASERVAVEGDASWYITRLPDGRWAAWDDAELALDRVAFFHGRQEAIRYQWEGWQDAGGDRDERVRWVGPRPQFGGRRKREADA